MSNPKVSIVVPCWGVEKYLDCCIKSLINQTLKDIEIILVDDVSPDKVPEMCDEWSKKDSRIKVIHKSKNEGLGMACNTGLELARGEYVAFCDSDDWVDPEMYETMHNAAIKYNCDAVFTGLKRVDMNGKPNGSLLHVNSFRLYHNKNEIKELCRDIIASAPNERADRIIQMSAKVVLYKRCVIETNNIRFVSERTVPSEDLHFNLNFLSHSACVCVLPKLFYNYRCNVNSITLKVDTQKFPTYKKLYEFTKQEVSALNIGKDVEIRIQRMFIGYIRSYLCKILTSNLCRKEKRKMVNDICKDIIWKDIWKKYPTNNMPFPHKIFSWAMKYNNYILLCILSSFGKK